MAEKSSKNHTPIRDVKSTKPKPKSVKDVDKKAPGKIGRYYGGTKGWKGVKTSTAKAIVGDQIRQQVKPLKNQSRSINKEGRRTVQGINKIYDETGKYIADRNLANEGLFNAEQSNQSQAQQTLQAQLSANQTAAQANVSSELMRLGISDGQALQGVNSETQRSLNTAALTGANNQANLGAMASGARSIGQLFLGSNAASRNSAITAAENDRRDAQAEVRAAINDARGTRSGLLLQLLQQMQQTGWAQHMDQQQLALQKRAAASAASGGSGGGSGGSGGGSGGSGGGSASEYDTISNLIGGSNKTGPNPWGRGPKPNGWGQGLGVLSNSPPKPKKPKSYGRGLGVLTGKKNPLNFF